MNETTREDQAYFLSTYQRAVTATEKAMYKAAALIGTALPKEDALRKKSIDFVLHGGKRFRPVLSYITAAAYGYGDIFPHVALECFHKYILTLDDVLDQDDLRYGTPTVRAELRRLGPANSGGEHFGNALAIFAGGLMNAAAYRVINRSELTATQKVALQDLLSQGFDDVVRGWYDQFLMDYLPLDSAQLTFDRIEQSTAWGTGRYSIMLPMEFGYTIAGQKPPEELAALAEVSGALFQMGDDLLGIFGNPKDTGKSNYGDIIQAKKTIPLWTTYQQSDKHNKETLLVIVGKHDVSEHKINQVRAIVEQSGGLAETKRLMTAYRDRCLGIIQTMETHDDIKRFLRGYMYHLETRDC